MSETQAVIENSTADLNFAKELIDANDPDRYRDIAEVLHRAARRYSYLADETDKSWRSNR